MSDSEFPKAALDAVGYEVRAFGQKGYNGVATAWPAGRTAMASPVTRGFADDPLAQEARVLTAEIDGTHFVNVYVVNGQSAGSPKYRLKLAWLDALINWIQSSFSPSDSLVVLGDFNIAPTDLDVYDPQYWHDRILCTSEERSRLARLCTWGLTDLVRRCHPDDPMYSWWDYRYGAFQRNRGLRIDLILGSETIANRLHSVAVDRGERAHANPNEAKPSDHAPVIATLA